VLKPFSVALVVSLEPVYSLIIAYFWFPSTERFSLRFYVGAAVPVALILLHSVRSERLRKQREQPAPQLG
jgi:drug/metabolite transporter (DMT)-like permease